MFLTVDACLMNDMVTANGTEKWQSGMHYHLRPPVPVVVLGFNPEASSADHNTPDYQISMQSGNAYRVV